jgi:hypothetical protein
MRSGAPLFRIDLSSDLFDGFGHITKNLVGILVGVALPDPLDHRPCTFTCLSPEIFTGV